MSFDIKFIDIHKNHLNYNVNINGGNFTDTSVYQPMFQCAIVLIDTLRIGNQILNRKNLALNIQSNMAKNVPVRTNDEKKKRK